MLRDTRTVRHCARGGTAANQFERPLGHYLGRSRWSLNFVKKLALFRNRVDRKIRVFTQFEKMDPWIFSQKPIQRIHRGGRGETQRENPQKARIIIKTDVKLKKQVIFLVSFLRFSPRPLR